MTHPIDAPLLELIEETLRVAKSHAKALKESRPESSEQVIHDVDAILKRLEPWKTRFVVQYISREWLIAVVENIAENKKDCLIPPGVTPEMLDDYRKTISKLSNEEMDRLALVEGIAGKPNFNELCQITISSLRKFFDEYQKEKGSEK